MLKKRRPDTADPSADTSMADPSQDFISRDCLNCEDTNQMMVDAVCLTNDTSTQPPQASSYFEHTDAVAMRHQEEAAKNLIISSSHSKG
jgi:hypothetical protein